MTQPTLWDTPAARTTDPVTSHEAAALVLPHAATLRARALAALRGAPYGLTDYELADRIGSHQTSAGKRRGELVQMGLVERTAIRRLSPHGARCIVWRVR